MSGVAGTQPAGGPRPAARLRGVSAYSAKGRPGFITVRLDANEGAAPPAQAFAPLHWDEVPRLAQRYPTPGELEAFIAERFRVAPEQVLVTAGVDDALFRACQALLEPGREIILSEPTFEMLPRYAALAGGSIRSIPWMTGDYPRQQTLAAINPRTSLIVVVTPNNPTGLVAGPEALQAISAAAPDAVLIVDLAYTEFADGDLTSAALQLPNAIAMRTLSKAWGLAGLRVGYAVGPARIIGWLRAAGNPFPTGGLSLLLARERLRAGWLPTTRQGVSTGRDPSTGQAAFPPLSPDMQASINQIRAERRALADQLAGLGWQVTPSQANFVLARSPRAAWLRDALWGMGIAIRLFPDRPGLADAVRITCPGDAPACARLQAAIETALRPQALLIDRGVLLMHESAETWRRLAARLPLALMNERPRAECPDTLARHGLEPCFKTIIHEGDAPQSPEPAFLRLALRALGVERAWVLSGRSEEMIAARVAGLTPIGVAPSGPAAGGAGVPAGHSAGASVRRTLENAGAARIVHDPAEILEWLP